MKIDTNLIHPELRKVSSAGKMIALCFTKTRLKVANAVLRINLGGKCADKSIQYQERYIERKDGSKLRICIYKPKKEKTNMPGILWIHGGGYGLGIPEIDYKFIDKFMKQTDCVIVSPDYRLSVEEPYPAALEDCHLTLKWLKKNADKLGVRDDQIMVGGDSAGGGLTAAVTMYARDKKSVNVAFQMPLYPMIDDRMITESAKDNNAPVWNSKLNYLGWKYYLGDLFETDNVPKYAAPSRETDYSNLPPTCTFVGSLEPFRDETIAYVENLKKAGVETHFRVFEGCYHGFEQTCPEASISKEANKFFMDTFNYAVEHYFAKQDD